MSPRSPIRKVLVANRGEIAVRIFRTCRAMGLATVAVHSDADAGALHVRRADQAVRLGPAPARESYLAQDRILEAARQTGADAIHPGYGFLSENAGFARAVEAAGLTFIGPPASAIAAMGEKTGARALMRSAGVPVVPGSDGPVDDGAGAASAAEAVGYPLLVKAVAGGGGRGLRAVERAADLPAALAAARREAAAAFGDDRVYLERRLERPRHVEIQVFGDRHGGAIHLGERECSVQRRHQKLLEESPSPAVDEGLRQAMAAAALVAARAVGYVGAGTVEFLLDAGRSFHFLEMNTRLQVEHPVTELVTGLDLVRLQLEVADGARLPAQGQIAFRGHAVEARLCAEDPARGFLPRPGTITALQPPEGPGLREDTGVEAGSAVTAHYDSLLSKLCAWGATRGQALDRLSAGLRAYRLAGLTTNLAWLAAAVDHPAFRGGDYDTGFCSTYQQELVPPPAGRTS
jgi:acetyl-CoA carboxylase biotin carboxylase subunit